MIDNNDLTKILESLVDSFQKEREKTDAFKELFKAGSDYTNLLRTLESQMAIPAFDCLHILTMKGIKSSNEILDFLLALPYLANKLEKYIDKIDGSCCHVDKSYYLLSEHLKEISRHVSECSNYKKHE